MARPYSADLRDRMLLAHEHGEGGASALARRFRIGLSTLYRWLDDLRDEGRRARGPWATDGGRWAARKTCCGRWWRNRTTRRWPSMPSGSRRAPGGGAVPRRSAAPCGGSACRARKVAPRHRAGPPGRGRGPCRVAPGARRHRAGAAGLPRRERPRHPPDPDPRPRPAGRARAGPCALEAAARDPDRGLGPGRGRGADDGRGRHRRDGLRRLHRRRAGPGPEAAAGGGAGAGQPLRPQDPGRARRPRPSRDQLPLSPVLLARLQSHGAMLGQA